VVGLAIAMTIQVFIVRIVAAAPYTPATDTEVLETLPLMSVSPEARRLQFLRRDLLSQPMNVALATRVASLYIDQGRRLSDPRYYGYAQAALAPWWSTIEPPLPVLILRATLRQHDHDFPHALDDLARALQIDPHNAQAWLMQAVVLQVRGEYDEARKSCLEVLQLATPLVAATCLGSVDSLHGAAPAAYRLLSGALARAATVGNATRLSTLTTLAEVAARMGHDEVAEAHFKQALALGLRDDYLLGAYADFLLERGRSAAVIGLLKDETRVDALLLRLALAEKQTGDSGLPGHVAILRDRFEAARRRGDTVHRREEGRFALSLLDQPTAALSLARDNWDVQKEPADARLLLESALAANDPAAAVPVLNFLEQSGAEDVALQRLGAIVRARLSA
jgi:tetratricopeptide (TPR) repeat protein